MSYLSKKGLIELAKSFARAVYFAVLGVLASFLATIAADTNLLNEVWTLNGVSLPVGVWIAAAVAFAAKSVDRYRHTSENNSSNGIAPRLLQR